MRVAEGRTYTDVSDETVRAAAQELARQLGLPEDWLNDGAKGYLHGVAPGEVVFQTPALVGDRTSRRPVEDVER